MGFSVIFDLALGLILLYLVLSITASAVSEALSNTLQWRAQTLERFVTGLLKNSEISVDDFYNNTLLKTQTLDANSGVFPFRNKKPQRPAYIRADEFSQAILDSVRAKYASTSVTADAMTAPLSLADWKTLIAQMPDGSSLKTVLLAMVSRTQRVIAHATNAIAESTSLHDSLNDWYNASQERVSGWYKARIQIALLLIGIGLAAALNIDTISVANSLLQNPAVRSAVEQTAAHVTASNDPTLRSYINELNIPIGWVPQTMPSATDGSGWLLKIVGILITGFAVSQGAPFWFDLLNKVTNLRSSGSAPATQPVIVNMGAASMTPPPVVLSGTVSSPPETAPQPGNQTPTSPSISSPTLPAMPPLPPPPPSAALATPKPVVPPSTPPSSSDAVG